MFSSKTLLTYTTACLLAVTATSEGIGATSETTEQVKVSTGDLIGQVEDGVAAFKGIPYAAPPLGANRWREPQAPLPWWGARDASGYGPSCVQWAQNTGPSNGPVGDPYSEDCLTVNVWAPSGARTKPLPIMLWIHGGGFLWGASGVPLYDGSVFAKKGIIVVTMNYRLGTLGYFAHPALTAEASPESPLGNFGTMDMIAALRWIKQNGAAFGGDVNNVTIAGESAGGAAVNLLLTIPAAQGLFHKAIIESGVFRQSVKQADLAEIEAAGKKIIGEIGLPDTATAKDLRSIPSFYFIPSSSKLGGSSRPFVDGRLQPEQVMDALKAGRMAKVPVLIGSNSAENLLPQSGTLAGSSFGKPARDPIPAGARAAFGISEDKALREAIAAQAVPSAHAFAARQISDNGADVFLYYFSYIPTALRKTMAGAPHGAELPYVFGTGKHYPDFPLFAPGTAQDQAMANTVQNCWISFMQTGAPICDRKPWPKYEDSSRKVLEFGNDGVTIKAGFKAKEWDWIQKQ